MERMVEAVLQVYGVYYDIVESEKYGSSGWLPAWWLGRANVVQCDYIAFVSSEMVEELFLESIITVGARGWRLAHDMTKWIPLLKRIQAAGKSLHLSVWPHEIRTLLEELRPEGLMLNTHVSSEAEAHDLLEKVAEWM